MQIRSNDEGENLSSQLMVGSPSFCEASHAPSVHAMITCRPERTPARRQPTRRSNEATKSYLRSIGRCRRGYRSCAAKRKRSSHCGRSSLTTLTETSFAPGICAIFTELRRLGYVEGKNILIERYSGEGRAPHYPDLARDVVRRNPDLIIAIGNDLVLDLKAAITTIPIVGTFGARVEAGIVSNLARPGRNITGGSLTLLAWSSPTSGSNCYGKSCRMRLDLDTSIARVPRPIAGGRTRECSEAWSHLRCAVARPSDRRGGVSPPIHCPCAGGCRWDQ
jgi:ABC transporter substrate binding protein